MYKYHVGFSLLTSASMAVGSRVLHLDRKINNESDIEYLRTKLIEELGYPIPDYLPPGHNVRIMGWNLLLDDYNIQMES